MSRLTPPHTRVSTAKATHLAKQKGQREKDHGEKQNALKLKAFGCFGFISDIFAHFPVF